METPYKIALDIFEGPLDLLLYLIRKSEIDIYDIPIESVTKQYLEYMSNMQELDINVAGDYFVMAASLMYIKSKMLLPPEERPLDEEGEDEDPRMDLVRQLLEYKKFKDAASYLHNRQVLQEDIFARNVPIEMPEEESTFLSNISVFDLIDAFSGALRKFEEGDVREIEEEKFTVAEKIAHLRDVVINKNKFSLTQLIENMTNRHEIIATFLALLELMRLKVIKVVQDKIFGEIMVEGING